jgi:hypothetical protein
MAVAFFVFITVLHGSWLAVHLAGCILSRLVIARLAHLSVAAAAAATTTYTGYPLHLVPYVEVDKLIQDDHSHGDGSYTIYLLNPPAHAPYAYTYQAPGRWVENNLCFQGAIKCFLNLLLRIRGHKPNIQQSNAFEWF